MKKMKYVLIMAALLAHAAAEAQIRFGVKGGVNVAGAKFDRDAFRPDNVTGFHFGPVLDAAIGQGGIGLDAAVLYARKGFDADAELKVRNTFLEVPVNVKFKLGLPLVNPYVAAGPYVDIRIAGDKAESIVRQIKTKAFGAGLNFGAGAELFNTLQLSLTYSLGLTDNYETFEIDKLSSYKGKSHTWSVSAAVFF
jgi:hypothetical protein